MSLKQLLHTLTKLAEIKLAPEKFDYGFLSKYSNIIASLINFINEDHEKNYDETHMFKFLQYRYPELGGENWKDSQLVQDLISFAGSNFDNKDVLDYLQNPTQTKGTSVINTEALSTRFQDLENGVGKLYELKGVQEQRQQLELLTDTFLQLDEIINNLVQKNQRNILLKYGKHNQ